MKNKIEELRDLYLNKNKEIKVIEARIDQRRKQIERLENKRNRLREFWGEIFIRPIMEMVKEKFPTIVWDDDRLTPMGLCNRISLFGHIEGREGYIILCFTPSNFHETGLIAYDTEEREGSYPENSIGYWNEMDKVREDITDINQIYNHIEKQLTSVKL